MKYLFDWIARARKRRPECALDNLHRIANDVENDIETLRKEKEEEPDTD